MTTLYDNSRYFRRMLDINQMSRGILKYHLKCCQPLSLATRFSTIFLQTLMTLCSWCGDMRVCGQLFGELFCMVVLSSVEG